MTVRRALAAILSAGIAASVISIAGSAIAAPADLCPTPSPTSLPITVQIPEDAGAPAPAPTPCSTATPTPGGGGTGAGGGSTGGSASGSGGSAGAGAGAADPGPTPTTTGEPGDGVAPKPPVEPKADANGLALKPDRVSTGESMVATGTGYNPGEKVQFVFYPGADVIGSFTADAAGTVVARVRIPDDMLLGDHVLEATGWISDRVSNGDFTVVSAAIIGGRPVLWWLIIVVGSVFVGLLALVIYFRRTIARWFGGGLEPSGTAS